MMGPCYWCHRTSGGPYSEIVTDESYFARPLKEKARWSFGANLLLSW